jgi:LPXTG-motif cell wall-anchored protein
MLLLLPTSATAQAPVNVTMGPTGGSGVSGTAQLTGMGNQTQVVVTVQGAPPNGTHVNHIHTGSCEQMGGIAFPLTDLRIDSTGRGSATTTVSATLATIQGAAHYVNVHAGPALPSPGVSCGNIPRAAAAAPAPAPAAPAAPAPAAPAPQPARPPAQLPRTGEAEFGLYGLAGLGALLVLAGVRLARRRSA